MDYPGNSYNQRGAMKRVVQKHPETYQNDRGHYYVRLQYNIWPDIYGDELPIHFPTEKSALLFATNSISETIVRARVYTPSGILVTTLTKD